MSRHTIPSPIPNITVTVGWDRPLQTYFAQVTRDHTATDQDTVLLWIGGSRGEITRVEDLIAPLAPYAELNLEHITQLRADRAAQLDRGPSTLQREMLNVFERTQQTNSPASCRAPR